LNKNIFIKEYLFNKSKEKEFCMKKFFGAIALSAIVLAGCASYRVWYRQDGLVPFEHFQSVQNDDERLVFISPVLTPNHRQSGLYIITNPEDITTALDTLGDSDILPPGDLDKALKAFSPVVIQSSRDISTVNIVSDYDISNQDGIAGFSVSPDIDRFFYAYMRIKQDYKWGSNDPTEVRIGIMPMPPSSQDVYIAFSEEEGDMVVSATMNPEALRKTYDTTTGFYGQLRGKKDQAGFITIGFKERVAIASEQKRAEALAAGATYSVYSRYYTYRQETRSSSRYVPEQSHWEPGQTTEFYNNRGGKIGEARTQDRQVVDAAAHRETVNYTVNVPVHHELAFEIYKGDVRVFRGKTPVTVKGIEVGTEHTLRWVSPTDGNRSFRFTMGLNFLGYPRDGSCDIK
jgi:hypothetical protein